MDLSKMLISLVFLVVAIPYMFVLIIYNKRHQERYPTLKFYIYSTFIQLLAICGFFLADALNKGFFRTITFGLSFLLLALSFGLMIYSLLKLLDKMLNKYFYYVTGAIIVISSITALFLRRNTLYFAMIILTITLFVNIIILVAVNYNRTKDQLLKWLPYTLLNTIPLVFIIMAITNHLFVDDQSLKILYQNNGQNIILEYVIALFATSIIGLVSIINSFAFSYLDLDSELFNQLFNSVPNIIVVIDPKTKYIKYVNDTFTREFGYQKKEVINTFNLGNLSNYDINDVEDFLNKKSNNSFYVLKTKNKNDYYAMITSTEVNFEEGNLIIVSMNDVSKISNERNEYRKLAYYDELTSLPNRRVLINNFSSKIASEERFALILLDIDDFKEINDTYGHITGDMVLNHVANILRKYDSGTDTVSRYGGDEFVLLISPKPNMKPKNFIESIEKEINKPFKVNNLTLQITASIGHSCFPESGHTVAALVEIADQALYEVKNSKKQKNDAK